MEAAARGARAEGGVTVGILPGPDAAAANSHVLIPIATDMGHARNAINVRAADAVVAVAGGSASETTGTPIARASATSESVP